MIRLQSKHKLALIVGVAIMLCSLAGYVALARMQPKLEANAPTKDAPVIEVAAYSPAGCPGEINPYPNNSGRDLALFEIVDRYGDARGYVFGLTAKRWGHIRDFPEWFTRALDSSSVLIEARDLERSPWYDGVVPEHELSLGKFLKRPDPTGLRDRFAACRLGSFWEDLHVAFASDLVEYCINYNDQAIKELESIDRVCGFDMDIRRQSSGGGKQRLALETAADRMKVFEAASADEIEQLLFGILNGTPWSVANVPAFSIERAERDLADLAEFEPLLHRLFVVERNRIWIPKIVGALSRGTPFIVANINQLPGRHGLLKGLNDAGFRVRLVGPSA